MADKKWSELVKQYHTGKMAEKEERILITQWNIKHDICPVPTDFQCGTTKSCDDCKVGMSRAEAINRMAKAAREAYRGYFYAEPYHPSISDMMEAALNALLEKDK